MESPFGYIKIIIKILLIKSCFGQIERDIILTPKITSQINGKTLYFEPSNEFFEEYNTTESIPWAQTLKHLTYITLNNQFNNNKTNNISELPDYNNFMKSIYIKSNQYIPKFGDIITLAKGRLERITTNEYRFIEGQQSDCLENCNDDEQREKPNILAYWLVQKIRHRDNMEKFRYEIKFSINPNINDRKTDTKRELNRYEENKTKSFILKDNDYPKSFRNFDQHVAQRRSEEDDQIYLNHLRQFNNIFAKRNYIENDFRVKKTNYNSNEIPQLNTGEYIRETTATTTNLERIGIPPSSLNHYILPTTYRPNYHVKFSKPPTYDNDQNGIKFPETSIVNTENTIQLRPPTTHLHHHYYLTRNKFLNNKQQNQPILNDEYLFNEQYIKDHRGGGINNIQDINGFDIIQRPPNYNTPAPILNQIPVPPNLNGHVQITQTPYSIPLTSPLIPVPPLYYIRNSQDIPSLTRYHVMQPTISLSPHVQTYLYTLPEDDITTTKGYIESTRSFIESPKYENTRYSEPDPLYANDNLNTDDSINENNNYYTTIGVNEVGTPNTEETGSTEEIETEENQSNEKPDSINAQLPPPDHGQDIKIPYVETSIVTEKSVLTKIIQVNESPSSSSESSPTLGPLSLASSLSQEIANNTIEPDINNVEEKNALIISNNLIRTQNNTTNVRPYFRLTTERPVLKWMPKNNKFSNIFKSFKENSALGGGAKKYEFERLPINNTENLISVTPSKGDEIQTKKSISTSISIKVGNDEISKGFVPTITVPNIELLEATLEKIDTNTTDINLYKASEEKETTNKEEAELTQSIVDHVRSLD